MAAALSSVSSYDPTLRDFTESCPEKKFYSSIRGDTQKLVNPPTELSAAQAINHQSGHLGVDIRPHLHDGVLDQDVLCDSGSQITAWPPDPEDKPLPNTFLRAVNGSKLNCYGYKQVSIKIGRKEYHYQAIKADVQSPILGWDFFKHYRIGFRWNRWGDVVLFDRKAKISQVLKFKSVPFLRSVEASGLALFKSNLTPSLEGTPTVSAAEIVQESEALVFQKLFQIAAMQELGEANESENVESVPEGPYKELIERFPDLLKPNFKTENPKNKISHRIRTGDHPPCRAKPRPMLPGSPKAVEGKKAFQQLIDLGIVEPVDPNKPTNWSSPLHLAPKPGGGLRPVGDYRALNMKTELDLYPLPDLRGYVYQIAGSKVFSKLDLHKAFHQIMIDPRDPQKQYTRLRKIAQKCCEQYIKSDFVLF